MGRSSLPEFPHNHSNHFQFRSFFFLVYDVERALTSWNIISSRKPALDVFVLFCSYPERWIVPKHHARAHTAFSQINSHMKRPFILPVNLRAMRSHSKRAINQDHLCANYLFCGFPILVNGSDPGHNDVQQYPLSPWYVGLVAHTLVKCPLTLKLQTILFHQDPANHVSWDIPPPIGGSFHNFRQPVFPAFPSAFLSTPLRETGSNCATTMWNAHQPTIA